MKEPGSFSQNREWESWFDSLKNTPTESQKSADQTIVYVIEEESYGSGNSLSVSLNKCKLLKKGGFGKKQDLSTESVVWTRYATPLDAEILLLLKRAQSNRYKRFSLSGKNSGALFEKILKTNRAFWKESNTPLTLGSPKHFIPDWQLLNNGNQKLECKIKGDGTVLPLSPLWYFDADKQACGPLFSDLPVDQLAPLLKTPLISPNQVKTFQKALKKNGVNLPNPKTYPIQKKILFSPSPFTSFWRR